MTNAGYDFQREMSNTDYQRNLDAQTKEYAYNTAMSMISAKKMPSDELLAAAGLNKKDVETWLGLNQQQAVAYAYEPTTTKKKSSGTSKTSGTTTSTKTVSMYADPVEDAQDFVNSLISESEYNKQRAGISQRYDSYQDYVESQLKSAYKGGRLDEKQINMIVDAWNAAAKK